MFEGLSLQHWRWNRTSDDIIHLIFDKQGASANTFSRAVMAELEKIVERLAIEPPKGVVLRSGKTSGFIAGADIEEFKEYEASDTVYESIRRGQKVFDRLEALECPTVAAIDGFCMGGGTEIALACNYRVASNSEKTRIGVPEVMLGIHPGWGGTVRLPRLIGAAGAMDMILTGRGIRPEAARSMGLVDRIVAPDQLISAAEKMITARPAESGGLMATLSNTWPARQALAAVMRKKTASKASPKHYPAPFAAIELWRKFGGNPSRMMVAEARSVARLAKTDTARNLVRVFFLRERVRALGSAAKGGEFQHVHVVGAGVMGGDIAAWCVLKGMTVTLQDREEKYITPALDRAKKLFEKKLKKSDRVADAVSRLRADVPGDGVDDADLIIEAIFENLEAKQDLFKEIEPRMKKDAILATNTSSIPLQDLRGVLKNPERLVGLHFFNPVAKMPLLEIVRHDQVDEDIVARCGVFARQTDKLGVPVTSTPGFLVNRILMPYQLEAFKLHTEGVPGPVLDRCMKKFGMPMGPIELADQVGLDVAASVARVLGDAFNLDVPEGLEDMVQAGKRGKKDGEGFYRYEDGRPVKPDVESDYEPPADMEDRMVLAFVNEAVRCWREEVVTDGEMLDAGVIFGTGFAPFRGGPYQYAMDSGPAKLKERLQELAARHGKRFEPDPGWDLLIEESAKAA